MLKDLSLIILGDLLNPEKISSTLNVKPNTTRLKNMLVPSVSTKPIIAKTGLWSWKAISTSELSFDDQIMEFNSVFKEVACKLIDLPNVSEIWLDFCLIDDNTKGFNSFSLSAESLKIISKARLPTKFTVYNSQSDAE